MRLKSATQNKGLVSMPLARNKVFSIHLMPL